MRNRATETEIDHNTPLAYQLKSRNNAAAISAWRRLLASPKRIERVCHSSEAAVYKAVRRDSLAQLRAESKVSLQ